MGSPMAWGADGLPSEEAYHDDGAVERPACDNRGTSSSVLSNLILKGRLTPALKPSATSRAILTAASGSEKPQAFFSKARARGNILAAPNGIVTVIRFADSEIAMHPLCEK